MTDYIYTKSEFIGLGSPTTEEISLLGLEQQIFSSGITTEFSYINIDEENVVFTFDQSLSTGSPNEELILDNIVATHNGTYTIEASGETILSYSFADKDGTPLKTQNPTYTRSATIVFEGTEFYDSVPAKCQISGYTEGSATGSVRLYDIDNDVILGEVTINSSSEEVVEMETSNWPDEQSTIELQMKWISGLLQNVVITSLQIIF